jgi:hypothetical protein
MKEIIITFNLETILSISLLIYTALIHLINWGVRKIDNTNFRRPEIIIILHVILIFLFYWFLIYLLK